MLRHRRLLAAGIAAAAAVAAAAVGLAAGPASAGLPFHAKAAHARKDRVRRPKLAHGLLTIDGTDGNDAITLRLNANDPQTVQVDFGGQNLFDFPRHRVRRIALDAGGGDDFVKIDDTNGTFTDTIPTTLDGGDGNDTLIGGAGAETLLGGNGNDSIDGGKGNDIAQLGAGDDTFTWTPGEGSDSIDGDAGNDTMLFVGANVAEQVTLSRKAGRLIFFRDIANVTMDTAGVEAVDFNALAGADTITVGDLTGTDVSEVNLDLGAGDGAADNVFVEGTAGDDSVKVEGKNGSATVSGLAATVNINGAESANDTLEVDTLGGNDTIDASGLEPSAIKLIEN